MKKVVKSVKVKAKRVDWKAACQKARRDLYKAQMELKESEKAGMEVFREHEALKKRFAELQIKNELDRKLCAEFRQALIDVREEHKQAAEIRLKACEETRVVKEQVKRQTVMYDDLKETFLEVRTQRDELEKDLNETEAACGKAKKDFEQVLALSRKLHEAVGSMLNGTGEV